MPTAGSLIDRVQPLVITFVRKQGFAVTANGDQSSWWGASVELRSPEFVITICRDRGDEWISVGTTVRPKPRAPLRRWPLGHVVGFLDGRDDPYGLVGLDTEIGWLSDRNNEILDVALINSEDLRQWAVRASRRLFGQTPRG